MSIDVGHPYYKDLTSRHSGKTTRSLCVMNLMRHNAQHRYQGKLEGSPMVVAQRCLAHAERWNNARCYRVSRRGILRLADGFLTLMRPADEMKTAFSSTRCGNVDTKAAATPPPWIPECELRFSTFY